jgi:hypothetical protein
MRIANVALMVLLVGYRVLVCHEYCAENYLGYVQLGCTIILLRALAACSSIMLKVSSARLTP